MDGRATCPTWERSVEFVEDAPISGAPTLTSKRSQSWLELEPRITDDGVEVTTRYSTERLIDAKPLVTTTSGHATATLPNGKWGLSVWSEGEDRVGVLAIRAERVR